MDRDAIRLECLKLWHRHDRLPAQVIESAKVYEDYVTGEIEKEEIAKKAPPPKKSGNPDLFK